MEYNDFDLTDYNSYRIKAKTTLAIFPETRNEFVEAINKYPNSIIIGGGNNIILSKKEYNVPFVFIRNNWANYRVDNLFVKVDAGLSMPKLSEIAMEYSLSGFETFYDIPGSVGGGITMNAGAGDDFISNNLIQVEAYDTQNNKFLLLDNSSCAFGYRESIFKMNKNLVITGALFKFQKGDRGIIKEKMELIKETRVSKQPKEYPNAGSVFKRPKGYFVGTMIQQLGLKGFSIGGAQVSEKHAGFIINKGGATGDDIIKLISHIKEVVYKEYNIELEVEQIII